MPVAIWHSVAVNKQFVAEALPFFIRNANFKFPLPQNFERLTKYSAVVRNNITSVIIRKVYGCKYRDAQVSIDNAAASCPRLVDVSICYSSDCCPIEFEDLSGFWESLEW